MRILMLTDLYWPLVGGLEQAVRALGRELTARGHQVAVATLAQPGLPAREDDDGVTIFRLAGALQRNAALFSDDRRRYAAPAPDPETVRALGKVVAAFRPDLVHGHNWLTRSYLPLKRRTGVPLVATLHDFGLACAKRSLFELERTACAGPGPAKCLRCSGAHYGRLKGAAVAGVNWAGATFESRLVDRYLPVSEAVARGNRLPGSHAPYTVIPNFHRLAEPPAAEPAEAATLPPPGYLLFVGALGAHKGLDVLLDAYALLDRDVPLVLIGSPWPGMPAVPDGVVIRHDWPHDAVRVAWERCAVGVIPSVWPEPFGLVALEAMAAARPVVASRIGGLTDIVHDGTTGVLVAPGRAPELAGALGRLLDDPQTRARMGRAGRERVEQFTPQRVVPRILAAYEDVRRSARARRGVSPP